MWTNVYALSKRISRTHTRLRLIQQVPRTYTVCERTYEFYCFKKKKSVVATVCYLRAHIVTNLCIWLCCAVLGVSIDILINILFCHRDAMISIYNIALSMSYKCLQNTRMNGSTCCAVWMCEYYVVSVHKCSNARGFKIPIPNPLNRLSSSCTVYTTIV